MKPDVSVIVPVYNTADFLEQCITSLIEQTLKNIELIFVDDGSTDNSVEILKKYQSEDDRIKIYRQQNLYAGVARNNGMKHATGKYIIFLDSDDYFERKMLEDLYKAAEQNQTDIVLFGFFGYDNETGSTEYKPFPRIKSGVFTPEDLGKEIFEVCDVIPWNKFYLREFVVETGLEFQNILNCNDAYFTRLSVVLAKRMIYKKKRYVHYRYNNCKSLQGSRDSAFFCFGDACIKIKHGLINKNYYEGAIREAYYNTVLEYIDVRFGGMRNKSNLKVLYYYLKEKMIPNFFDTLENIPEEHISFRVHTSENYEDFLENELLHQRDLLRTWVPRVSIEYRIGRLILKFPRKILKLRNN
jgi:glycosyltransferase involved in cell wall biosynthesis